MEIVSLSVQVLGIFLAALAVPILAILLFQYAEAGLVLIAIIFLLETSFPSMPGLPLGILVYPQDIGYALLFVAALARILFEKKAQSIPPVWMFFGAVLAFSFLVGLAQYGKNAGVSFRTYFYFWCVVSYAATFAYDETKVRRVLIGVVWIAVWVQLVALQRWFGEATGLWLFTPPEEGWGTSPFRVVSSFEALALGDAVVIAFCLLSLGRGLRLARSTLPILGPSLLVLQHRSVWLAVFAGIATAMRFGGKATKKSFNLAGTAFGAFAVAAVLAVVVLKGSGLTPVSQAVGESAKRAVLLEDTAGWRLYSWQQLVEKWAGGGIQVLAFGFPFGTSAERYSAETKSAGVVNVAAHNAYVQTLYNSGLVGIGCFLFFAFQVVSALWRQAEGDEYQGTSQALLALIVCQLVYYVPYGVSSFQAALMGIAVGYLRSCRSMPSPVSESSQRAVPPGL
jgi:hypothetical protein